MKRILLYFLSLLIIPYSSYSYDLYGLGDDFWGQLGDGSTECKYIFPQKCNSIDWKTVAGSIDYSVGIDRNKILYAWGLCPFCKGDYYPYWADPNPYKISNDNDWETVVVGNAIIAKKTDGSIWGMGLNSNGELGDNNDTLYQFTRIGNDNDWRDLALGTDHVVAVKNDGTIWTWGKNDAGQLGNNSLQSSRIAVQIGTAKNWTKILAGFEHSAGMKSDGSIWAWGRNKYGRFGLGMPDTILAPMQVGTDNDWVDFAVADEYMLAVKSDGSLWQFGNKLSSDGKYYELVNPEKMDKTNEWIKVFCYSGSYRSRFVHFAMKADKSLWAWGNNNSIILGLPDSKIYDSPMKVKANNNWKTISCGMDYTLGLMDEYTSLSETKLTDIIFPNPTQDRITVYVDAPVTGIEIEISDAIGNTLLRNVFENSLSNYYSIDVSKLEQGLYFCKVISNGKFNTQKFIIVR